MVTVPNDIAPTVNTLPRHMKDTETITVKFKRHNIRHVNLKKMLHLWLCGKQQTTYLKKVISIKMCSETLNG